MSYCHLSTYKIIYTALLLLVAVSSSAEVLKGRVVDSETKEPLSGVQVLLRAEGPNYSTYDGALVATDSLGRFCRPSLPMKNILNFIIIGYKDAQVARICNVENKDTVDFGDIEMKMSSILLKGAVVKGHRKLFYMRGDTVVYDPRAFNLRKGERVERLLKKLPGVSRDASGALTWNGKPVQMLINGKENKTVEEFLPNLAVEAIDKIKVYDARSAKDKVENREGRRVLDVRIKPEWMEKWYGNVGIMGQTEHYYNLNANGYRLSDKLPFNSYFNLGDGNHNYWPSQNGSEVLHKVDDVALRTLNVGLSATKSKSKTKGQNYSNSNLSIAPKLSHSDNRTASQEKTENYMSDNSTTYSFSNMDSYIHSFEFTPLKVNWNKFGSKQQTMMSMDMAYENRDYRTNSDYATFNRSPFDLTDNPLDLLDTEGALGDSLRARAVSSSRSRHLETVETFKYAIWLNHSYKLSNRNTVKLDVVNNLMHDNGHIYELYNTSLFHNGQATEGLDKQYSSHPFNAFNLALKFADRQSLLKGDPNNSKSALFIEPSYRISYSHNYDNMRSYRWRFNEIDHANMMNQLQYLPSDQAEMAMAYDSTNAYRSVNDVLGHTGGLTLEYKLGKFRFTPQARLKIENERLSYNRARIDTIAHRTNVLPEFETRIEYSKSWNDRIVFTVNYEKTACKLEDQMTYTDDSNPLYIYYGNPLLRGSRKANYNLNYQKTITKAQLMLNANISLTQNYNATGFATIYDPTTGVTRSQRENIKGGHCWIGMATAEWMATSKIKFTDKFRMILDKNYRLLSINASDMVRTLNAQHSRNIHNEFSTTYNGKNLELTALVELDNTKWKNSNGMAKDYNYWNYTFGLDGTYNLGEHWSFNIKTTYEGKDGYMTSFMNKDRFMMDASINWHILKNQGTLSFIAADIFNQYSTRESEATASYRTESSRFSIHNYYCLKFVYNFDGRKKK